MSGVTLDQLHGLLTTVNLKLDVVMAQQDEINAAVTALSADLTDLTGTVTTEIQALKAAIAAGQPLDLGPLEAKVAALGTAVASVKTLAAPAAPPPPT